MQSVLERKTPERPVLFEFFLNDNLYRRLVPEMDEPTTEAARMLRFMQAYYRCGYDYVTLLPQGFSFTENLQRPKEKSVSQNVGSVIHSQADLARFRWPDPARTDFDMVQAVSLRLPAGMKVILYGPGGVLENAIELVGYEDLCLLIKDEPALADRIFGEIGSRLEEYYRVAAGFGFVGACISNDDWGFKTHTLFRPAEMRRFVFPWHKRIVQAIHAGGKPAILHSCGNFERIIDDVIDDMGYDGRHSYEDSILPVEEAYERFHQRIAILGGIDLDFVCRSQPEEIYQRSKAMLARTHTRGSFALGTGNSVPEYVPDQNYLALIRAAIDEW